MAGCGLASGTGAAGDTPSSPAYLATVLRDTSSLRAISALDTPAASISRISCLVERGTVIFLSSRGRVLGKARRPRDNTGRGRAPSRASGTAPLANTAQFPMRTLLRTRCELRAVLIEYQQRQRQPPTRRAPRRPTKRRRCARVSTARHRFPGRRSRSIRGCDPDGKAAQHNLNYYAADVNDERDNPPIGIILCTDKQNTAAKYALGGPSNSIFATAMPPISWTRSS